MLFLYLIVRLNFKIQMIENRIPITYRIPAFWMIQHEGKLMFFLQIILIYVLNLVFRERQFRFKCPFLQPLHAYFYINTNFSIAQKITCVLKAFQITYLSRKNINILIDSHISQIRTPVPAQHTVSFSNTRPLGMRFRKGRKQPLVIILFQIRIW